MASTPTRVLRFQHGGQRSEWDGVCPESYKLGQDAGREWAGIVRHVLAGNSGEQMGFQVRYFEIAPGGYSSLEKHAHAHVVIAARGTGRAVLGGQAHTVRPFDAVYVAPWTPHQFLAAGDEPFGFLCIVDDKRDQPRALSADEAARATAAGAVAPATDHTLSARRAKTGRRLG